jgi:hypothetical protein
VWSGIVLLELEMSPMTLDQRDDDWSHYLVNVSLGVQIAVYNDQLTSEAVVNGTPDHHTSTAKWIPFPHAARGESFVATPIDPMSTICFRNVEPRLIRKNYIGPESNSAWQNPPSPLYPVGPVTLGKDIPGIWPTATYPSLSKASDDGDRIDGATSISNNIPGHFGRCSKSISHVVTGNCSILSRCGYPGLPSSWSVPSTAGGVVPADQSGDGRVVYTKHTGYAPLACSCLVEAHGSISVFLP